MTGYAFEFLALGANSRYNTLSNIRMPDCEWIRYLCYRGVAEVRPSTQCNMHAHAV